jgi:hypothetical protein
VLKHGLPVGYQQDMVEPAGHPSSSAKVLDGPLRELDSCGMTLAKVQQGVKELSHQERAELLDWLWDELQPGRVLQVQERWAMESEERIDAVDRSELPTVEERSAIEELRRSLGALLFALVAHLYLAFGISTHIL